MMAGPMASIRAAVGRMFARQVGAERYPETRFVVFGNSQFRLSAPEDALKVSTAWRCVSLKAETTAALEWKVRKKTADGQTLDQPQNGVEWLLSHEPNPEMGAFDFRRTLAQHMLTYGNGYAEIQRDGAGRPVALWPIGPDRIEPQRTSDGRLFYRVNNPTGGYSELAPRDVFHVRGMGWDGLRGYSIMELAADTMKAAHSMDRFAGNYFASGMLPSMIIEAPAALKLSPEAVLRMQSEMAAKYAGSANAGKPLVLDGGMTAKTFSADPEKGQFVDTRKFTVYDVCRWFGVPPYLAFASDGQPRANVEMQSREFYGYGLMPMIVAFEQEANRKLLSREFGGLFTKMNTDELLRGDYQTSAQYYQTMRNIGAFTINDVLRMEGMDSIGPEGDVRHMQMQQVPVTETPAEPDGPQGE